MLSLRHRGPDASGQYAAGNTWLAHTRLSILDPSAAGNQPMQTPDGRFVITYNGEVYNFRELARAHGIGGLRSGSDTEVVLRLFEKSGAESCGAHKRMLAFAIYDKQKQKLWLVRDRLGIKPLFYQLDNRRLIFASEVKAIFALNPGSVNCDIPALHEWLYFGNPLGGRTLYGGIRQLLPGHYLEIDLRTFDHEIRPYWTLEQQAAGNGSKELSGRELISRLRGLVADAVKRQLVSDVPIGVFLSGGVDSSAITALAARYYGKRLTTYSASLDFSDNTNELSRARDVAKRCAADHHELRIEGGVVGDLIEDMVDHHDMPFSDAANIPLYLMAREIARDVKVVLQGDGGDEVFGGYGRYTTLHYYPLLRAASRTVRHLSRLLPESVLRHRIERYMLAFGADDLATTMALLLTVENPSWRPTAVFAQPLRTAIEKTNPFRRFQECQAMFAQYDREQQMSLVDLTIVLPDTYLEKVDRSTMAASLEVRVPLLDHDLVDFMARLPGSSRTPRGRKKWLLKQALRGIVPPEVLTAPKTGLTVPYGKWLQGVLKPLFFDHLAKMRREHVGILDTDHIGQLFARTCEGKQNHSFMLWKVLNFMIWWNKATVEFS